MTELSTNSGLNFLRLFDNPLSKYLIFKIISRMKWLFWVIYQNYKGEKEGKTEIQQSEYLRKEKSFLDEIKNFFNSF